MGRSLYCYTPRTGRSRPEARATRKAQMGSSEPQPCQGWETTTYTYDALGNLVTVLLPSGTRIDYLMDGQNQQFTRTESEQSPCGGQ